MYARTLASSVIFEDKLIIEDLHVELCVGEGEDVKALDLVLPLMYVGETAEVIADPDFAYGRVGFEPHGKQGRSVPANAAVTFRVELVECKDAAEEENAQLETRMTKGRRKKDRGNFWYAREEYTQAIQCYRKATDYFDDPGFDLDAPIDRFSLEADLQELLGERIKAFNNLAQSQIKIEAWDSALAALSNVLKVEVSADCE